MTNINLTPIFDAITVWLATIIAWLKSTYITIWTFSFSLFDFFICSTVIMGFVHFVLSKWIGVEIDEINDAQRDAEYEEAFERLSNNFD